MRIPKRNIKDSVFTNLFRDKKYLLQLYQALHPEDKNVNEDDISNITIQHVLVDANYNDLGFLVEDRLIILVESQSTWTPNIIIRALLYLAQTYHDYCKSTNQNLYNSRKVNIPKPELYVVFTGERKDIPDSISLREEYFQGEEIAIDVTVKIRYHESEDIVGQYIIFSKVYQEQRRLHGQTREAIAETIRICKSRNILKQYLESKEQEVVDIMMTLFDEEEILDIYVKSERREAAKEAAEKATKKAEKKAMEKAAKEAEKTAERMIRDGKLTLEEIAHYIPSLSMEKLKEIEHNIMQMSRN